MLGRQDIGFAIDGREQKKPQRSEPPPKIPPSVSNVLPWAFGKQQPVQDRHVGYPYPREPGRIFEELQHGPRPHDDVEVKMVYRYDIRKDDAREPTSAATMISSVNISGGDMRKVSSEKCLLHIIHGLHLGSTFHQLCKDWRKTEERAWTYIVRGPTRSGPLYPAHVAHEYVWA